ncbi:MAG TPA: response regulator [Burkholderiales bacterium]|nr:response regulator [Burkholderiales bacterium]
MIARAIPRSGPKRGTLLYVENHADSVVLVDTLLAARKDLLLMHAPDANLAIELARSARPEAILIDIDLAGMSALEFMKVLRADPATEATPILALGANASPEAIVKALEAGFFQYLTKPLRAEPFLEALAFALEFAAVERSEHNALTLRFKDEKKG